MSRPFGLVPYLAVWGATASVAAFYFWRKLRACREQLEAAENEVNMLSSLYHDATERKRRAFSSIFYAVDSDHDGMITVDDAVAVARACDAPTSDAQLQQYWTNLWEEAKQDPSNRNVDTSLFEDFMCSVRIEDMSDAEIDRLTSKFGVPKA